MEYPLPKVLEVMKPSKINKNDASHNEKLEMLYRSPDYVAEEKIDGCHYTCINGRFFSIQKSKKTGFPTEKTDNFPHLVEGFLKANLGEAILDGEIYYPDTDSYGATKVTNCSSDTAVSRQEKELGWVKYKVFDILRDTDGTWMLNLPWYKRRERLEQLVPQIQKVSEHYELVHVTRSRKKRYVEKLWEQGKEGIVLKNTESVYLPGKRPMWVWVKVKIEETDDVIIIGFDEPQKEYTGDNLDNWPYWKDNQPVTENYYKGLIGSIRIGKYDAKGNIIDLGSCTGMSKQIRKEFSENKDKYKGKVIEIKAMEKTEQGYYRSPNFVRLHPDKNSEECVIEE